MGLVAGPMEGFTIVGHIASIGVQVQVCKIFENPLVGQFLVFLRGVLGEEVAVVAEVLLIIANQDSIG